MKGIIVANIRRASLALTAVGLLFAAPLQSSATLSSPGGTTGGDSLPGHQPHRSCSGQLHQPGDQPGHENNRQQDIVANGETAIYYRWRTTSGCLVNLVVVDLAGKQWILRTVANVPLATVSQTAVKYGAAIAINGGFFDTATGAGVGCVIDQGTVAVKAVQAKSLISKCPSPAILNAIRNRSELRQLVDAAGTKTLCVSSHIAAVPAGVRIAESLQAGPELLPHFDPAKEAFIRKNARGRTIDSINTAGLEARTAIGITADGGLLLLTVSNPAKGPDKGGMTLRQVATLLKSLGAVQALNFDGGTSTTMYLCLKRKDSAGQTSGTIVSGNWSPRRVQSVLLLQAAPEDKPGDHNHLGERRSEICLRRP